MPDDPESNQSHSHLSLRQQAFKLLEKNHILKPSQLCKLLGLSFEQHGNLMKKYRYEWKRDYKNRLGLKCLKFHAARGWIYALRMFDRENVERLIVAGWRQTRARNRMIVWDKDKQHLGRLEWFTTGRINIWVRKPATWGKVKQLLAKAFMWNKLIESTEVFELWANTARFKGAHAVYDYGQRVPYAKVEFLKEALGVVVKTGDVSHPTALEIEFVYPDWAEKIEKRLEQNDKVVQQNSQAIENFNDFLKGFGRNNHLDPGKDRNMVS
jgi:hypothetical protein